MLEIIKYNFPLYDIVERDRVIINRTLIDLGSFINLMSL